MAATALYLTIAAVSGIVTALAAWMIHHWRRATSSSVHLAHTEASSAALAEARAQSDALADAHAQQVRDLEARILDLSEDLQRSSDAADRLRVELDEANRKRASLEQQAGRIVGEANRLKGLAATFERWHEQMTSLMTQNQDMHEKNQELSSIVRHVVIVSLNASIEAARAGARSYRDSLHRNDLTTTATFQDIQAGGKMIAASLSSVESLAHQFHATLH